MVGTTPATIVRGVVAADANASRAPITPWDQALAAFAADPPAMVTAITACRLSVGSPVSRVSGLPYTGAPAIIAADPDLASKYDDGRTMPWPSMDFRAANPPIMRSNRLGDYRQSWTVAMMFAPDATANGNLAYGFSGSTGGNIKINGAGIYIDVVPSYDIISVPRARLVNDKANMLIVCGDAATRQIAIYLNSRTPVLSAVGVGPAVWPEMKDANGNAIGDWVVGNGANGASKCRIRDFTAFDRSLHHDPASATKFARLIAAGAKSFGIALV